MKPARLAVAAACLTALAGPVAAQQRSITLREAIGLAAQHAPNVVQAAGSVRSAGAGVRAAWGSFLPDLRGSATYGTSFSEGPSRTDPITGQAAWYDLRVRIEKVERALASEPRFSTLASPGRPRAVPGELRYGQEWGS